MSWCGRPTVDCAGECGLFGWRQTGNERKEFCGKFVGLFQKGRVPGVECIERVVLELPYCGQACAERNDAILFSPGNPDRHIEAGCNRPDICLGSSEACPCLAQNRRASARMRNYA